MHFKLPTIALAASILASGVLAIPHGHMHMHMRPHEVKRALTTENVWVTRTQTDWVTVIWDGTSYITPVATPVNAAQTAVGGAEAHVGTELQAAAAAVTQPPAPIATQTTFATVVAPSTPAAPVAPAPVAVDSVPSTGDNVAGAVAGVGNVVGGVVSSVLAPIIQTPEAPVIPTPTPVVVPPTTGGDGNSGSTGSTGGGKRGLAYNNANLVNDFLGSDSKISWAYNWGSNTPSIPSTVEYVPMIWGTGADHSTGWNAAASAAIAAGSKHLLAFNEPDFASQSNLDPGAAAAGYRQFVQPFAGQARLGAPAVTNGGAPMGLTYLQAFLAACADCTIDFVPIHWYDAASNIAGFKKHVADMKDVAAGRPLWITEFQATGSVEEQDAFLREVLPWLDGTDYVERYAYFYADGVLTQNNAISTLGNTFKTFVN